MVGDIARERLELKTVKELEIEKLEKLKIRNQKLELKKLKQLRKLETEIEILERQEMKRTVIELNKLANNLNVELVKVSKKSLVQQSIIISNLSWTVDPINSSLKNKILCYCDALPFVIISFNRYINIQTMDIIFSYDKKKNIIYL